MRELFCVPQHVTLEAIRMLEGSVANRATEGGFRREKVLGWNRGIGCERDGNRRRFGGCRNT